MAYADYRYYRDFYLGERISEEKFPRLARLASTYLDRVTFRRAGAHSSCDTVRLACCAVAEEIAEAGEGRITSEMVGNWSRAYRLEEASEGRRFYDAASLYLDGTGLLYRGCDGCSSSV